MITEFQMWRPADQVKPKGILVLTPPSQCDGRYMALNPNWQAFATKHDLAIVGCYFQDDNPGAWIETYCNMSFGAGEALIAFVKAELKTGDIPKFLLWGFSAGGQFNFEFANAYPQYVAAFVVNKGGVYFSALASDEARKLPALFIIGSEDSGWRKNMVKGLQGLNAVAGARLWYFIEEKGYGHSEGRSAEYGRTLFESILED